MDDVSRAVTVCPRHRESFGIRWWCNKKSCTCPSEWALHKTVKGDHGITLAQSEKMFLLTEVLIAVGSRKYAFRKKQSKIILV